MVWTEGFFDERHSICRNFWRYTRQTVHPRKTDRVKSQWKGAKQLSALFLQDPEAVHTVQRKLPLLLKSVEIPCKLMSKAGIWVIP